MQALLEICGLEFSSPQRQRQRKHHKTCRCRGRCVGALAIVNPTFRNAVFCIVSPQVMGLCEYDTTKPSKSKSKRVRKTGFLGGFEYNTIDLILILKRAKKTMT